MIIEKPERGAKLKRQFADCKFRQAEGDDGDGDGEEFLDVAFASEEPYEWWWGTEILSVEPGAIDMSRLENGAPFLVDHRNSVDAVIGVVERVSIGSDKVARASIRLSKREGVAEIVNEIRSGILGKISVSYQIDDLRETEKDVYTVTRWTPLEISLVAIPADDTVGVGRSVEEELAIPPQFIKAKENTMSDETQNVKLVVADDEAKIMALAEHVGEKDPNILTVARDYVAFGKPFEEFRTVAWDALQRHAEQHPVQRVPATQLDMSKDELGKYSLFRAIGAAVKKDWKGAELELEASRAIAERIGKEPRGFFVPFDVQQQQRTLTTGGAGTGAEMVGTDHLAGSFIDALRTRSVVVGAGATMLTGLVGNVDIPKLTGSATFYWLAEGADVTLSDPNTGSVTLSPTTVAGAVAMTRRLLKQSDPSVEAVVLNDLVEGAALAIDLAAIDGSGTGDQPTGVVNQADVNAVTLATPGQPTWAEAVAFETAVDAADALMGTLAYITTPAVVGHCKVTPKDAGSGLFLMDGMSMNGYPVRRRTGLAQHRIVFGNWADVLIGMWGVLDVAPDPAALAASGGLVLRVFQDIDVAVRHGESFANANVI